VQHIRVILIFILHLENTPHGQLLGFWYKYGINMVYTPAEVYTWYKSGTNVFIKLPLCIYQDQFLNPRFNFSHHGISYGQLIGIGISQVQSFII